MLRSKMRRWAAGGFAAVVLLAGAGFARLAGEDKPAAKEDKPAVDPKDVRVGPPPELAELRKAVEEAARAGENVAEIRKQLDALEKVLAGKAWVKPKPVEEPPAQPTPPAAAFPGNFNRMPQVRGGFVQPPIVLRGLGGLDADAGRMQAELLRELAEQQALLNRMGALEGRGVGRLADARLGVRIEKVPAVLTDQFDLPAGRGLVVTEVRPGSPADKAGLKINDVILEFAGKPVTEDVNAFVRSVEATPKGQKVDLTVLRKGKKEAVKGVELPDNVRRFQPPEPPAVPPVPPVAGRGGLPAPPAVRAVPLARVAPVQFAGSVSIQIVDGTFTLTAEQDGVKYVMEGTVAGGKGTASKIHIADGDKPKIEVDSVDKVPAEYRKQVEGMLSVVGDGDR